MMFEWQDYTNPRYECYFRIFADWYLNQTFVSYANYAACRSPLNFASPDAFLPARWLSSASEDRRDALQPFSLGPRNCIGQRLAWAETRLILAKLLWHFDVEEVEEKRLVDWSKQKTYTLWEKTGGWVRLKHRADI